MIGLLPLILFLLLFLYMSIVFVRIHMISGRGHAVIDHVYIYNVRKLTEAISLDREKQWEEKSAAAWEAVAELNSETLLEYKIWIPITIPDSVTEKIKWEWDNA